MTAAEPRDRIAGQSVAVGLNAVVVAVEEATPRVLLAGPDGDRPSALPSGPLEAEHRTMETGLRSWVERQTGQPLGYVEQLYPFGDKARAGSRRFISIAYLALVRGLGERRQASLWADWYAHFPYEDWRSGRPPTIEAIIEGLKTWSQSANAHTLRRARLARIAMTFGLDESHAWNEERVLERYELLYEAGLVAEAGLDAGTGASAVSGTGQPLALDHRRMLATAIGRLRAKIKYRPVLFELMPDQFTLFDLQRTAEALSGVRLHKPNFRRLIEAQGLVEETGNLSTRTGGRPAKLFRYRPEVTFERPLPGARLPVQSKG